MTSKKNEAKQYISKMQTFFDIFNSAKNFLFTFGVIVVALINLWLANKLNPVIENIRSITNEVEANSKGVVDCKTDISDQDEKLDKIMQDVGYIRGVLDSK